MDFLQVLSNILDALFEFLKNIFFAAVGWVTSFGLRIVLALAVLLIGLKCAKYFSAKIKNGKGMARLDKGLASFLNSLVKILLYAAAVILCLLILGIPAASFVTAIASCGVAVGLALQGSLTNFAGGIMLLTFKPFKVGDYIEGSGHAGTVEEITILYTHIVTSDNIKVCLPNGTLSNGAIVNYTALGIRRADISVRVSGSADIAAVKNILRTVAENAPNRLKEKPVTVEITDYVFSNVVICIRYYADTEHFWNSVFATRQTILDTLKENGVSLS